MDQYLTRDEILNQKTLPFEDVPVKSWLKNGKPGIVHIVKMPAIDVVRFTEETDPEIRKHHMAHILAWTIRDPKTKERLFQSTKEDLEAIMQQDFDVLSDLQKVAFRLNGLGNERKNLVSATATVAAPTDSPLTSVTST